MRLRRRLYAPPHRAGAAEPAARACAPGILSTSELATLWQLPRARAKLARIPRVAAAARRGAARDLPRPGAPAARRRARPGRDRPRGPQVRPGADRRPGVGQDLGHGARRRDRRPRRRARDRRRSTPRRSSPKLALGLIPAHRTVHYIDLGQPEIGFNPLTIDASPGTRASVFLGALIEANPPGAIQARSDDLLRQAVTVVCAVEQRPTVWDVYRMLSPGDGQLPRAGARPGSTRSPGMDFARYYWRREFPELLRDRSRTLEVLDPPLNKLAGCSPPRRSTSCCATPTASTSKAPSPAAR